MLPIIKLEAKGKKRLIFTVAGCCHVVRRERCCAPERFAGFAYSLCLRQPLAVGVGRIVNVGVQSMVFVEY
jgi:hypothetical protein